LESNGVQRTPQCECGREFNLLTQLTGEQISAPRKATSFKLGTPLRREGAGGGKKR